MLGQVNQSTRKLAMSLLFSGILAMSISMHFQRVHTSVDPLSRLSGLRLAAWLSVGSLFMVSCAGDISPSDVRSGIKKALSGTDEQIFLGDTVDNHYHPNVIMKRGEAYFEKEEYAEALVEYKHFLELHHNHVLAPYAAFRMGEIHFKMAKSIDRDPEPMQKAIAAFEQMRKEFPGSRYDTQAQQKLQECHEWLAQMHLFVGQFYFRRGSYLAAAHRFEQILKNYPDKPIASDALYSLAKAYHELGADDWARDKLIVLAEKYPDSTASGAGRNLLEKIGGAQPRTLFAQKSEPASVSDADPTVARNGRPVAPNPPSTSSLSPPTMGMLGIAPSLDSLGVPSASTLGQAFTPCRLGAWC
jgi:outer membrane protein assembly factor BamD